MPTRRAEELRALREAFLCGYSERGVAILIRPVDLNAGGSKQESEAIHEPFLRRHVERCTAIIICLIDRNAGRGEQEPDAFHVVTECC